MDAAKSVPTLYAAWEAALVRLLVGRRVPADLVTDVADRLPSMVPALTAPSRVWFDDDPGAARDRLMIDALTVALRELQAHNRSDTPWGRARPVTFAHPLAVTAAARTRFNVGPFAIGGYPESILAT
jgi:hypothetical protein